MQRSPGFYIVSTLTFLLALLAMSGCGSSEKSSSTGDESPVSGAPRTVSESTALAPLIVAPREPAVPFKGSNGKYIASYELQLLNPTPLTITPTRVVISTPDGKSVETLTGKQVASAMALPGERSGVSELTESQVVTLYLSPEFDSIDAIPDRLEHVVTVTAPPLPDRGVPTEPIAVDVEKEVSPPVLGPPLEAGSGYLAADSCCDSDRHRRALLPIDNNQWLAQRFAVDWEQLDASGRTVRKGADATMSSNYTIYGKQAIAAADGTVESVVDGLPDQEPGALPESSTLPEADGNNVVIDLGGGFFMLYAHLKSGSLKVKQGDKVKRGQPIGLVGNSGNTSAPHLHFHVMDGPSALTSEGVPYVIDSFAISGTLPSNEIFEELENTSKVIPVESSPFDGAHADEMPLNLNVVTFE
ncbi:MAG: M23 family metallopeptidase [Solirubrobacterales bacterium]